MSIFYACVKRGDRPPMTTNNGQVPPEVLAFADQLCTDIDMSQPVKKSYKWKEFVFNYTVANELLVLCACHDSVSRRISFAFIERIRSEHVARGGGIDRSFLKEEMVFFSTNPEADKIRRVQAQVDDVKEVMLDNLEKILMRGEKLEDIDRRTDDLRDQSMTFQRKAKQLKCALIQQNMKLTIVIVALVLFILIVLAIIIYLIVQRFT